MPPHTASRLAAVREGTHRQHVQLDAVLGGDGAVFTVADYRRLLRVNAVVLARFGTCWDDACANAGLTGRAGPLRAALNADLGDEGGGHERHGQGEEREGPPSDGGDRRSLSISAGVGYALEGSALGARTIIRRLKNTHGLNGYGHTPPTRFYELLSASTADRWPRYCRWLDTGSLDADDVIEGARSVFELALVEARTTMAESPKDVDPCR